MKIVGSILIILAVNILALAQTNELSCGSTYSKDMMDMTQHDGKYLTASGELKVLVVFAKIKGDTASNPYWPADSYPSEMNNFVDSDLQKGSTHFLNLTNYYNQMSFGKFRVTGKAIGVETPYPLSHYIFGKALYPDRAAANTAILKVVDDSIDYKQFDNWKLSSDYRHINAPDGIIDMIIVIWRGLVFSDKWSGEMSLGYGGEFWVENRQKRILMCFGSNQGSGSNGSGVTVQYWGERTPERNFKVVIHEIAHWLIQVEHPYSKFIHTCWGMLTLGSEGICANAFERERLGWLTATPIEGSISSAPISDYISTPSVYKYHPPNGYSGEMYYFENHQQISIYDNGISNPDDKGIFITHLAKDSYSGDCIRILTSDGFWNWDVPLHSSCWGNDLPSFKKGFVNRNGLGNRDKITAANSSPEFLYSYVNENNQSMCNDWLHGYGFINAFDTISNDVFSSWSNPPAKTWDGQPVDFLMEVINQSSTIITVSFAIQNSIGGKPSKPAIGWNPRKLESAYQSGWVYLAWGADYWDGNPIEADVNWSELQRKIGSGSWSTVYSGSNRVWSDGSINSDMNGIEPVYYRVRVRDSQNKWSIWSELFNLQMINGILTSSDSLSQNNPDISPLDFNLYQNYPNPFNPSTKISWQSPISSWQVLKVYDVLGNEVATLVNEFKPAGYYQVEFNATGLPSGVYLYKLQAGNFVETKKLMLLK
jgi:M6 family metalloprotease-like protein